MKKMEDKQKKTKSCNTFFLFNFISLSIFFLSRQKSRCVETFSTTHIVARVAFKVWRFFLQFCPKLQIFGIIFYTRIFFAILTKASNIWDNFLFKNVYLFNYFFLHLVLLSLFCPRQVN